MDYLNKETQSELIGGLNNPEKFIATYNRLVDDLNNLANRYNIDADNLLSIVRKNDGISFDFTPYSRKLAGNIQIAIWGALADNNLLQL